MTALEFLYRTVPGRACLKILTRPGLSRAAGRFLDTRASKFLIAPFVKSAGIDLTEFDADNFTCFNDCFTRKIKPGLRPADLSPGALISPCDGLLSVYKIDRDTVLPVKQSRFTLPALLDNDPVWREFAGGTALVFRLCVENYHRYCYMDSGVKNDDVFIPGRLHTVRPIALETVPVYTENSREYTVIDGEHLGSFVQMEVGALLVGRISNHLTGSGRVEKGAEKGTFLYGGSTIIALLSENTAKIDDIYTENSSKGMETPVKYGQKIGKITEIFNERERIK